MQFRHFNFNVLRSIDGPYPSQSSTLKYLGQDWFEIDNERPVIRLGDTNHDPRQARSGPVRLGTIAMTLPRNDGLVLKRARFVGAVRSLCRVVINASTRIGFNVTFYRTSNPYLVHATNGSRTLLATTIRGTRTVTTNRDFVVLLGGTCPVGFLGTVGRYPRIYRVCYTATGPLRIVITRATRKQNVVNMVSNFSPGKMRKPRSIGTQRKLLHRVNCGL